MRIGDIVKDVEIEDVIEYGSRAAATSAVFYALEGCIANRYELNWFGHLMVFGTSCMLGNIIVDSNNKALRNWYERVCR